MWLSLMSFFPAMHSNIHEYHAGKALNRGDNDGVHIKFGRQNNACIECPQ